MQGYLHNIVQLLPRRIDSGLLPVQCISVIQSSFYPAELSGTLFSRVFYCGPLQGLYIIREYT
jgi:hypothetical protein